ncbi:leucine aminopeptidase 1 [Karstenula rhodostoma CBS 690.94]|uniref:Peptide hydrolase n=1 Tax=Karstenula rhodostoma CBS 690.94 TaxID=1392251 RepID=A0A9P4P7R8_9PLEO|nr:leucine aminopeptidase 1 [Karstenula rhodostoma CBS 690.94]
MKLSIAAAALTAYSAAALSIPARDAQPSLRTIELSPGNVKQVTEEQKFDLLAQGTNLIDITEDLDASPIKQNVAAATFPASVTHQSSITPLLPLLSTASMRATLEPLTQFRNRYFNSTYGAQSSEWLLKTARDIVSASGAVNATVEAFGHSFLQSSIIARIPGRSEKTIVLGAHQDSINSRDADRVNNRAPGADDDGSGTVTILEALRVVLTDEAVRTGNAPNTLELHWYAAEEGGLLGSVDIWKKYKAEGRDVKAMLQQDMTGYSKGTTDKGKPEVVGVITDYVDAGLTEFITKVVDAYCDIGYVRTECGYGCSDHASAYRNGYPSAFVFESDFTDDSPYIHTSQDTLETVNFDHMLQHAKLTVGFAYELAFATDL